MQGGPQYPAAGWGASTSAMPADKDTSKPWVPPAGGVPPAVPPPPPGYPPQQAGYAPQQQAGFAPPPGPAGYGIPQPPPPPPGGPQRQGSVGSGMYIVNVDPDTATAMAFAQTAVRNGFVRKVFGIVAVQMLITVAVSAVCLFRPEVKAYLRTNGWPFYAAWGLAFGLLIVISCVGPARRRYPLNVILLAAFTAAQAFLVGMISAQYNIEAVGLAFLVTGVAVGAIALFAVNTKIDVTRWGTLLLVALVAFVVLLLVGIFLRSRILYLVIAGFACLLFSAYLLYDIQLVMGGRYYEIGPDEYVMAALSIYLDIINLFIWVLALIGLAGGNN